jgi:hypothetical protein
MYEVLLIVGFFLSITLVPWWLFRRMKRVRQLAYDAARDNAQPDTRPTEDTLGVDGDLSFQHRNDADNLLIEADKQAAAMPDIGKTLSGQR